MTDDTPETTGTVLAVGPRRAAPMLDVEPDTLKRWRMTGKGPRYSRIGNRVRYRIADLEAWLAEHTVTPEPAAAHQD
ncbi:helix-turn-helix domain-containing protein [Mycobacterium sp.]|uniref:helix-turn-helix domain-containing protein n=1 Tax=Mycobacterium sp. TaxID=1785 RepID=UPI003F94F1A5